jgi:uncharacterized protein (TIGR03066 family)
VFATTNRPGWTAVSPTGPGRGALGPVHPFRQWGKNMRAILGCSLVLVLCCGLSADDKKADPIDTKKLVGKWEPKDKKEGMSAVVEFTKDGKVNITLSGKDKDITFGGSYKVDGNKVTTVMTYNGKESTETHTITKLTDTELVSKDDKGREETLVRVKTK